MEKETAMNLSPAAQAVLDATGTTGTPLELAARGIAAAALQAAAEQMCYARGPGMVVDVDGLLAVVAELEAQ
jgi:hypothetical protein